MTVSAYGVADDDERSLVFDLFDLLYEYTTDDIPAFRAWDEYLIMYTAFNLLFAMR